MSDKEFDSALAVLADGDEDSFETHEPLKLELARISRKIDGHILPILCLIYIFQYLDKSLLNYAAAMGIKKHLVKNQFANLLTVFYGGYIAGAPFSAYCLQRFPLLKALGLLIVLWGIVCMLHAACKTYAPLMIVRALLGFFESSSAISLIVISGMYYTKSQQASRMGYWSSMLGVATIIGALLSFGFQHISRRHVLESWQILFLVVGGLTTVFGAIVAFTLPDTVSSCSFLLHHEQVSLLKGVVLVNKTGTIATVFKKHQLWEMLDPRQDPFTWPFFILVIMSQIVTGALGSFSVTVTLSFGFNRFQLALLQIPPGVLIIIIIMGLTLTVRYLGRISQVLMFMFVPSIVGTIVLLCQGHTTRVGQLLGLYLQYSGSCLITLLYAWTLQNTSGATKKFFRSGLTMVGFLVANLIGPQLFRASEAPKYPAAKYTILFTQLACIPLVAAIRYMLKRENLLRDGETTRDLGTSSDKVDPETESDKVDGKTTSEKVHGEEGNEKSAKLMPETLLDRTERENHDFRYTY